MNPLRTVTGILTLPARTAGTVAAAGLRTTTRVVGWAVEQAAGPAPTSAPAPAPVPAAADEVEQVATTTPRTKAPATKTPANKTPAKKSPAQGAPAGRAPAKKAARKKAPSKKAAVLAPALGLTEEEAEDVVLTPSGIPAAGEGTNPDTTETDLHQPGTEPLMDPATVKAVTSEARTMQRAAETDKG